MIEEQQWPDKDFEAMLRPYLDGVTPKEFLTIQGWQHDPVRGIWYHRGPAKDLGAIRVPRA